MTGGPDALWGTFLEDGAVHAGRLRQGLAALARSVADGERIDDHLLDDLGVDAYAVATLALLMGMADLAGLAQAVEQAVTGVAEERGRGGVSAGLQAGVGLLADSFTRLANPDASGARIDLGPVRGAREVLLEEMGEVRVSGSRSAAGGLDPGVGVGVGPEEDERTWTPTCDEDMVDLFIEEATERLEGLAQKLLSLEERRGDAELVREIFRDLHTVKGSSGMVGLRPMNRLAHAAEDLVGQVRDGARRAERPLIDALLAAIDGLRAILDHAIKRAPIDVDIASLVRRVKDPMAAAAEPAAPAAAGSTSPAAGAAAAPAARADAKHTLRVDFEKLDLLLNLVGELVLSKAGLSTGIQGLGSLGRALQTQVRDARRRYQAGAGRARRVVGGGEVRDPIAPVLDEVSRVERVFHEVAHDLDAASGRLDRVSSELRDQVMKLRMVPIAGVFRKYHRTVRDLANGLGKKVRLELTGEDTELDKILVEQLDDPLMHLVRNAVDHGVEPPDARVAAGKPPEGVLRLSAYHRGNQIVIEIADDGGGIDPERVRKKAREKEIAGEDELAAMNEREVLDLIFRPGFSTAARISEVSGRGVGMDVVREAIVSRLKGVVDVSSTVGKGTTFTLRLPLTLAIIQVLLARAGGETFCIPIDVVKRTLTCKPSDVHVVYDREVLAQGSRGAEGAKASQIPLIRLRDALELETRDDQSGDELHVILVEVFGTTYGLVCERLLGKQEIVIKTLGDLLEEVSGAAGATLLGDRCAVILDVPAVVARALRQRGVASAPPLTRAPARPASPGRARILLVEDSDTVRESLRRLLDGAGYEVVEARDGAEGLRIAEGADFDLISTDVVMPNLDGYELTRALRAGERHKNTPIVMVTSRGEKIDRVRGFDAGVDEYITKPHDRQELLAAVAKHVKRPGAAGEGGKEAT